MYDFVKFDRMNKGTFTYALLQYHHSQLLGEVLNIGLIVYFPIYKRFEFLSPDKLIRLRFAYPDVPEKTIKSYFKYFEKKVDDLNKQPDIFHDSDLSNSLKLFLETEFLAPDSSVLQFGNFRTAVLYSQDLKLITNQLYNLYFSVFEHQENTVKKIDESILLKKYKKFLTDYLPDDTTAKDSGALYIDYTISPNSNSSIKFDVAWKGITDFHLVKPISFDLAKPDYIQKKAYQFFGQFLDLQDFARENKYQFDVILAKPKSKQLSKAYDNAIRLLEKPAKVKLIEQDDLKAYSEETVASILS